jgi:hypothetical protein
VAGGLRATVCSRIWNSLRRLRTECDTCHANLPRSAAANRLAPPGEIVADILALDADFDGLTIKLDENLLQVQTYPIVLGDTALGRFRIELCWQLIGREPQYGLSTWNTPGTRRPYCPLAQTDEAPHD